MNSGAQTPEELEMLFEDSLLLCDPQALADLFEDAAVLVMNDDWSAYGREAITQLVVTLSKDGYTYIANPQSVLQARDIALIVSERGINVGHRGNDGRWRYAIVHQSVYMLASQNENDMEFER